MRVRPTLSRSAVTASMAASALPAWSRPVSPAPRANATSARRSWQVAQVESEYLRQHHRQCRPVRDAEPAAERVADGVADAQTGAGHGGPGQMRRQQHLGPRLPVRAVGHGVRQVGRDHPHDLQGDAVRPRVGAPGQVRLQGVGQRVHPGRGGAGGRQAQGQVRVEDRGGRQRAGVADVELAARLHVGHYPERVRLRAGPGGGGHGDQGQRGAGERAAVVESRGPAAG